MSNFLAVSRTVAPVSMMYWAKRTALSSGKPFKPVPPLSRCLTTNLCGKYRRYAEGSNRYFL